MKKQKYNGPKILLIDIEISPIVAHVWQLWDNNVALNQIVKDWHVLSWSAKWYEGSDGTVYGPHNNTMYMDQRNSSNIEDDKAILKPLWDLIDSADVLVGQNSVKFDAKKLNARFIINGFSRPSSYKHIDTYLIGKKHFSFTSNKLEYMCNKLCVKYKKSPHSKFAGHVMWTECLKGNLDAWNEMEKYNKQDVYALEELTHKLLPWDNSVNFNLYTEQENNKCSCGSETFIKKGYYFTALGKFQRWKCKKCGCETRSRKNLFSKEKISSLKVNTVK